MRRSLALSMIAFACAAAPASAQELRTTAPCSPVIDRTQGNVTVTFSGGCTVGIAPAELAGIIDSVLARRAVPPELLDRFESVSRAFGVTDTALATFFRILGERKVATEDLDARLREVAARHVTLVKQAEASADDDPQVVAIKQEAVTAIGAGDYARADNLLRRAFDADLAAARRAQEAASKALEIANKRFLTAAKTRADMGELDMTQLRYADAAEDFQAAADLVPAGEALVRADYLARLGLAAYEAGNYPLAGAALAEALSIQERLLGPEHPAVAARLNTLGALNRAQARYGEAERLFKRALAIDEKLVGPSHPTVAIRLNNLATVYLALGRHGEALALCRRALAIDEKARGPDHPRVAIRLTTLAALYRARGRDAEAEPLLLRALAIDEKALGAQHPDTALRLTSLSALYRAMRRYAEAEPLSMRALAINEKVFGPEHPRVAGDLHTLALLYRAQGRDAEAEPLFQRAIAISEKTRGPDHPALASELRHLAELYQAQGRNVEAESLYKRALAIGEKALGSAHRNTQRLRETLRSLQDDAAGAMAAPRDEGLEF